MLTFKDNSWYLDEPASGSKHFQVKSVLGPVSQIAKSSEPGREMCSLPSCSGNTNNLRGCPDFAFTLQVYLTFLNMCTNQFQVIHDLKGSSNSTINNTSLLPQSHDPVTFLLKALRGSTCHKLVYLEDSAVPITIVNGSQEKDHGIKKGADNIFF